MKVAQPLQRLKAWASLSAAVLFLFSAALMGSAALGAGEVEPNLVRAAAAVGFLLTGVVFGWRGLLYLRRTKTDV